jgi:putative hydrolase of the HAD superfamily
MAEPRISDGNGKTAGPIRAVFCDFGGVIYRTPSKQQFRRTLRWFGIRDMSPLEIFTASPLDSPMAMALYSGSLAEQEGWNQLAEHWHIPKALLQWLRKKGYSAKRVDLDLLRFLNGLRPDLRIAVLTNAGTDFRDTFGHVFNLETYVDRIIISAEEHLVKPTPEIYHHAAALMGVEPNECIFVDDLPENVTGAQEVGMCSFMYENGPTTIQRIKALISDKV